MKRLACFAIVLATATSLDAAAVHLTSFDDFSGAAALAIPDGNYSGVVDTRTLSLGASGATISEVKVGLNISGGFNGDLYGYLSHGTGYAVLLNRPGLSAGNSDGYFDSGLDITFSEGAATGIQDYQSITTPTPGFALTGDWAPDGRNVHPESSGATFDGASRDAGLDGFNGLDPDGEWHLFIADLISGDQVQLESWSLEISVVPEPQAYVVASGLLLIAMAFWRRRYVSRQITTI